MDSAHKSVSFLCWYDDQIMRGLHGAMPSVGLSINANEIAKYNFDYTALGGFEALLTRPYEDVYETSNPIVGLGNVSRVVFDGSELEADVLSAKFELLPAPSMKGTAFGGFQNKGGLFYGKRQAGVTLDIAMEDDSYFHRYRAMDEVDFLLQCGSVATSAMGIWSGRSQIVEIAEAEGDKQRRWTIKLRFLRPTAQGQPAFLLGIF
jgi:hypothetical protein